MNKSYCEVCEVELPREWGKHSGYRERRDDGSTTGQHAIVIYGVQKGETNEDYHFREVCSACIADVVKCLKKCSARR